MTYTFAGWLAARPNSGSFKIGHIVWKATSEPAQPHAAESETKPKRWLRRKPPPDSSPTLLNAYGRSRGRTRRLHE